MSNLSFSSGEGNYVAEGLLNSGCVIEFAAMREDNRINPEAFADIEDSKAFIVPEKDAFNFPMGLNEFVSIAAKKYGKIQYRRFETDEWKYGWIDSINFKPNDGEAEFSLITCK